MYYNSNTDKIIYKASDIRELNPNTSFPSPIPDSILEKFGFEKVITTPQPPATFFTEVRTIAPVMVEGKWTQYWEIVDVPRTEAEIAEYVAQVKAVKLDEYRQVIQERLDIFARTRGYDNIVSLCSYATSHNVQFAVEGNRGVFLRDQCWATGYMILGQVEAGTIPEPTIQEILDQMPEMTW